VTALAHLEKSPDLRVLANKECAVNSSVQSAGSRDVTDAPKKSHRRTLDQLTGSAAAQRGLASRVMAENPERRLAVSAFNSSI
jgi:hypothetical protein